MFQILKEHLPGICKEGYIFILIAFLIMMFAFWISNSIGVFMFFLTICCAAFFRDPIRITPQIESAIIGPGDGKITSIIEDVGPKELQMDNMKMKKISIFLSVFDVHINRIPVKSTVKKLFYRKGKFLNAALDKSSIDNEAQFIKLITKDEDEIAVTQIAGLIAQRIVCDLENNMEVDAGEKFGIIRFGSRVDLYLPISYNINVLKGQTVIGGETIIAYKGKKKINVKEASEK